MRPLRAIAWPAETLAGKSHIRRLVMLEVILWVGAVLWTLGFIQLIVNLVLIHNLAKLELEPLADAPFVSIVVPARDEEKGIREAVTSFCSQDYPAFEVIVVDDCSTDGTAQILTELQKEHANLRVIAGKEPPAGWLGKPHALETGQQAAGGDWLLFVDADVVYAPDLLRRAIAYVRREEAAMLFLWPNLTTRGWVEAAFMSTLYLGGMALVPMFLVTRSKSKAFAAGGGVFNLVRRDALTAAGAFTSLKAEIIDDVGLGFKVKGAGFRLAMAMAGPLIHIRMYDGAAATLRGFTKNAYPVVRAVPWFLPLIPLLSFTLNFAPYYGFVHALLAGTISVPASIAICFMHLVFGGLAVAFRQSWAITFLNPVREAGWWWILARSMVIYYRKGVIWRGRIYRIVP
jgi:glycosyltransferase involved in cell wall biosynthesis